MNTLTKNDPEALRAELRKICQKRERGDLTDKSFQRAWTERSVDLFRAVVSQRLAKEETIQEEHHVIRAHFKLTHSVLKEPEQLATSLFATDRRLIRLRSVVKPNQPVTGDKSDQTVIDDAAYDRISTLKVRREIRPSEIAAGLVIVGVGYFFYPHLDVTGPFMIGLGGLGVFHGLILPTRWIEVIPKDLAPDSEPIFIYLLRRKSARRLVRFVRARTHRG